MKLIEGIEKYGHQMHLAIKAMVKDVLGADIEDDTARQLTNKLGLSDVLALDTALDDQNEEAIRDIISQHISLEEYSLPGRGSNLKSQASIRPLAQKTGGTTRTTTMTKPVAGGNKVATGGVASVGAQDDEAETDQDAEKEIADREQELANLKKKAGIK